jgi:alkylhydroperoxidase/carboxymuconolactone decarboxylase family protein YurZ
VYATVADRVQQNMALSSGGDLDQFAMLSIYGELMAEERILDAKETGLLEFVVCYVSGAAPQAKGHMYGSRNLGNGKEEILRAVGLCRVMAGALGVAVDGEGMGFVGKVEGW